VSDGAQIQKSVEDWYNSGMDRQSLSKNSSLRQSVVAMAEATAKEDATKDDKTEPIDRIKTQINALDGIGPSHWLWPEPL
jgi:hypothetical protein